MRSPAEHEGRDLGYASTNHGTPKTASNPNIEWERGMEQILFQNPQKEPTLSTP